MMNLIRRRGQPGCSGVRTNNRWMRGGIAAAVVVMGAMTVRGMASAPPLPDFTVNLNPVSGRITDPTFLVADKLTGNYSEVLSILSPTTFKVEGYWDGGQLVHGDGTVPYTGRESRLGVDYSLYALFSYAGTYSSDGTGFQFAVTTGSFTLYADRRSDTGKILSTTTAPPIAVSGNEEDVILASATLLAGGGHFQPGNAFHAGDFGLAVSPVLTALGSRYFVAPAPFYSVMLFKGQLNSLDASLSPQVITGSADISMQ